MENAMEELMTPEDVARALKVKPNTVYQMRKRGILPAANLGLKSVRFRRRDVQALIEGREKTTNAQPVAA